MDFQKVASIAGYLSKDYAEGLFRLLTAYKDISASEAASRMNLHIRTVQDFLEALHAFDIVSRKEVFEKKRPYYRYTLKKKRIEILLDLDLLFREKEEASASVKVREHVNAGARFAMARNGEYFSTVSIWSGEGRKTKERKINLTSAQGRFLYFLPFPDATPLSIEEIMDKGDVDQSNKAEIVDLVEELHEFKVIEKIAG